MNLLLLAGGAVLSLAATGCGGNTGGRAQVAVGEGPGLPDASFEGAGEWMLAPRSRIDDTVAHGGARSLRVELDHGLGSDDVTRSAYLTDIEVGPEYVLDFHYRYEGCKSAIFTLIVGDYQKQLRLEGSNPGWTKGSMVVSFAKKPAWVDITAGRRGAADEYADSAYDDNVLWLDDLTITRKSQTTGAGG